MEPLITAGAGFLLGVLWMDLMHDLHVVRRAGREGGDPLAPVAAYYRHVLATAAPMGVLIALVMLATLAAGLAQAIDEGRATAWATVALLAAAIGIARVRTIPAARRMGPMPSPELARSIRSDHLVCALLMTAVVVLQLAT